MTSQQPESEESIKAPSQESSATSAGNRPRSLPSLSGIPHAFGQLLGAPLIWAALICAAAAITLLLRAPLPFSPLEPEPEGIASWLQAREQNSFRRLAQIGGNIHDIVWHDGALLAATDTGLYRSESEGRLWRRPDTTTGLRGIAVAGDVLFAIGEDGSLQRSDDKGETWQRQTLPEQPADVNAAPKTSALTHTTLPIRKVVNTNEPPTTGSQGKDLQRVEVLSQPVQNTPALQYQQQAPNTESGGPESAAQSAGTEATDPNATESGRPPRTDNAAPTLRDLQFPDANNGWLLSENGALAQSRDGGRSWSWVASRSTEIDSSPVLAIHFLDAQQGWLLTSRSLYRSSDAGQRWQQQFIDADPVYLRDVSFVDEQIGWLLSSDAIYVTNDGGASWQLTYQSELRSFDRLHFRNAQQGWAVGVDGLVFGTQDGGASWLHQTGGELYFGRQFWLDGDRGWISGDAGAVLATNDGGNNWRLLRTGNEQALIDVYVTGSEQVWVTGDAGLLMRSVDGGKSWTTQNPEIESTLSAVHFFNSSDGLVIGTEGLAMRTRDAGASWQRVDTGSRYDLWDMRFFNAAIGWAVGRYGTVLRTVDSGQSWQLLPLVTSDGFSWAGLALLDADSGWLVGEDGAIFFVPGGNRAAIQQDSGTEDDLFSIQMQDANTGWISGRNGTLLYTTDGGAHWKKRDSGTSADLVSVHFVDANRGWAAGSFATLLRSNDGGENWQAPAYGTRWPWAVHGLLWFSLLLLLGHVLRHGNSRQTVGVEQRSRLLEPGSNDNTVRHVRDDKLDTGRIARSLSWFLQNRSTQAPLTLAVTGAWGSGKSSVMRMMQSDLQAAGYSTVWFNAWHQNNEETMLAALVETLRQQGIPPWYSLSGFWFGCKLVSRRLLRPALVVLMALLLLAMALHAGYGGGIGQFSNDWQKGWQHAETQELRRQREKQPVTINSGFLEQFVVAADQTVGVPEQATREKLQPHRERRFDTPKALEEFLNKEVFVVGKADVAGAESETETQARLRFLNAFHEHYFPAPLAGGSALATRIANRLHEIWEDMQGLLLGGGAAGATLLALLTLKNSLSALGNTNGWQMFRRRVKPLDVEADPGLRYRIQRALEELARACGERRLVIFIDDVDRCPPKQQRKVLEIANTLHAASDGLSGRGFFIVLGAALDVVVPAVASDMQDEVTESVPRPADISEGDYKEQLRQARIERARLYLEKIVNMEVHIAATSDDHLGNLFAGTGLQQANSRQADSQWAEPHAPTDRPLHRGPWDWLADKRLLIDRWTLPLLLSLLLGASLIWLLGRDTALQPAQGAASTSAAVSSAAPAATAGPAPTSRQDAAATNAPSAARQFVPPSLDSKPDWLELLVLLLILVSALLATALLVLKKLEVRDRADFIEALRIWSPVIGVCERTPRHVKRASNQLRYFSMRIRQRLSNEDEADALSVLLVVVRAMRDLSAVADSELNQRRFWRQLTEGKGVLAMTKIGSLLTDVQLRPSVGRQTAAAALIHAHHAHLERFGMPDAAQWQHAVEAYEALSEGIVLR